MLVDYVREMTPRKSCNYGKYGLLVSALCVCVCVYVCVYVCVCVCVCAHE